jgi:hypothetical protein
MLDIEFVPCLSGEVILLSFMSVPTIRELIPVSMYTVTVLSDSAKTESRLRSYKAFGSCIKLSTPTSFLCFENSFLIYDVGVKIYKALKDVLFSIVLASAVV